MNPMIPLTLALALFSPRIDDHAPIRLATFNIHHGEGDDGKLDLERIAGVVREADIVAFQEVDVQFGERSRFEDQAERLGKLLKFRVIFGANLIVNEGKYGVALASRFPIVSSRNHRLPHSPGREKAEPRGVLEAVLDVNGQHLRVFVTHLAHDSRDDRRIQVASLREVVGAGSGPAIVMGDLNFRPDDENYPKLLARKVEGQPNLLVDAWSRVGKGDGPTIGLAGKSPGRIDYILVTEDLAAGLESIRVDAETKASDHQPVFATVKWPAKP